MKTNCIVCNTELENLDIAYPDDNEKVHPIDGTVFRTYGHYGSTVFDPMDASYLEIVVCDRCLQSRLERTYNGVDKEYKNELDAIRLEAEEIISQMELEDLEDYTK
jgi:uncharacterized protein (DUF2225 family)